MRCSQRVTFKRSGKLSLRGGVTIAGRAGKPFIRPLGACFSTARPVNADKRKSAPRGSQRVQARPVPAALRQFRRRNGQPRNGWNTIQPERGGKSWAVELSTATGGRQQKRSIQVPAGWRWWLGSTQSSAGVNRAPRRNGARSISRGRVSLKANIAANKHKNNHPISYLQPAQSLTHCRGGRRAAG